MSTAKKTKEEEAVKITIPPLNRKRFKVKVISDSPLITNCFNEKAKNQIQKGQSGEARRKAPPRNPEQEFKDAMHHPNGIKTKYGFPAIGYKKAIVSSCRNVDGITMTLARQTFFVEGIEDPGMVTIKSKAPIMREDWVRIGGGRTTTIRYRPEYRDWSAEFIITYNADVITPGQIINLVNQSGFGVGVGEWRPEKGGNFGRYHVEVTK